MMRLWKRLAAVCAAGTMLVGTTATAFITTVTVRAWEYSTYENLTYDNFGDQVEIVGCDKEAESVVIPAELDGLPVTGIEEYAFSNCTQLRSVTLPDTVEFISYCAFSNCESLEELVIPDSVQGIGEEAFRGCTGLTSLTIGSGVTRINEKAFYGCTALTSVSIPDSVTIIGEEVFKECSSLTSVTIGDGVTSIYSNDFENTPWFENKQEQDPLVIENGILINGKTYEGDLTIPDNVRIIACLAFSGFYTNGGGLTSVTIPESVTSIGEGAFFCCSSLTSVTILNPQCELEGYSTICNYALSGYSGVIYGYDDSTAQAYARENHCDFSSLGASPQVAVDITEVPDAEETDAADIGEALETLESTLTGVQEAAETQRSVETGVAAASDKRSGTPVVPVLVGTGAGLVAVGGISAVLLRRKSRKK